MTIHPAPLELVQLADRMRPDWIPGAFEGALQAARSAQWDWDRTFKIATRIIGDPDGTPMDLLNAVRDPRTKTLPADPHEHAARARQLLAAQRQTDAEEAP